jgi:hypothetical protein
MRIYSSAAVTVNGKLLAEATSVEVEYLDSDEVLFILGGGTSKTVLVNPQGRHMRITWDQAVPSEAMPAGSVGFIDGVTLFDNPYDYVGMYLESEPATISVIALGRTDRIVGVNGLIQQPKLRFAVGQNTTFSYTWIGEAAEPESNLLQLTQFA